MKRMISIAFSIVCLSLTSLPAESSFPRRPITMIVPFGAGGASDTISRVLSSIMAKYGGEDVNVVNRTGGAGMVGLQALYNSRPEGYIVGHIYPNDVLIKQILNPDSVKFDVMQFTWLAKIGASPFVLIVGRNSSYGDLSSLRRAGALTWGVEHPGRLEWATSIIAAKKIGLKQKFVFGLKTNSIIKALREQRIDIAVADVNHPLVIRSIKQGSIKPILNFGESHIQSVSDIPTATELGLNITLERVQAIVAPPGVPRDRIKELERLIMESLNDSKFQRYLREKNQGLHSEKNNSDEAKKAMKYYYNLFNEYKEILRNNM